MADIKKDFVWDFYRIKNFINLSDQEKETVLLWRNNDAVRKWMCTDHSITPQEHSSFIEGLRKDNKSFYWIVQDLHDNHLWGVINLTRVDMRNCNAYLGVYANPCVQRQGAGKVLMRCLRYLAFDVFALHTLKLEVLAGNERAMRFYQKEGFIQEGRLSEFVRKNDQWNDVIIMGIVNQ